MLLGWTFYDHLPDLLSIAGIAGDRRQQHFDCPERTIQAGKRCSG
jgi:hypothetical protein